MKTLLLLGVLTSVFSLASPRDTCFVFDGDSRTAPSLHTDYPDQLVLLIPNARLIANLGQPGATSLDIFDHILPVTTPNCRNIYILWVGIGDLGRGWPVYSTLMNIYYALGRARGAGYEAFVLSEPPILDPDFIQDDPQRIEFDSVITRWPETLDTGSDSAWIKDDGIFITDPSEVGCCYLHLTGAGSGVLARDIALLLLRKFGI